MLLTAAYRQLMGRAQGANHATAAADGFETLLGTRRGAAPVPLPKEMRESETVLLLLDLGSGHPERQAAAAAELADRLSDPAISRDWGFEVSGSQREAIWERWQNETDPAQAARLRDLIIPYLRDHGDGEDFEAAVAILQRRCLYGPLADGHPDADAQLIADTLAARLTATGQTLRDLSPALVAEALECYTLQPASQPAADMLAMVAAAHPPVAEEVCLRLGADQLLLRETDPLMRAWARWMPGGRVCEEMLMTLMDSRATVNPDDSFAVMLAAWAERLAANPQAGPVPWAEMLARWPRTGDGYDPMRQALRHRMDRPARGDLDIVFLDYEDGEELNVMQRELLTRAAASMNLTATRIACSATLARTPGEFRAQPDMQQWARQMGENLAGELTSTIAQARSALAGTPAVPTPEEAACGQRAAAEFRAAVAAGKDPGDAMFDRVLPAAAELLAPSCRPTFDAYVRERADGGDPDAVRLLSDPQAITEVLMNYARYLNYGDAPEWTMRLTSQRVRDAAGFYLGDEAF